MNRILLSFIVIFFIITLSVRGDESENKNDISDLSLVDIFDFIVIGSGAAGSIIASRLANETTKTVLLLEGGHKGTGQRDIGGIDYVASYFKTDPVTGKQVLDTPLTRYDVPTMWDSIRMASDVLDNVWNISSIGPFPYAQTKNVGGNQASNGLVWYTPMRHDLDKLGVPAFSADNIYKYIRRVENATETGYPNRGNAGRINVNLPSFVQREQLQFRDTLVAAGFATGGDVATGYINASTVYFSQANIKRGIRQSSSIKYLAPVLGKKNLEFRTSAIVTRVLFSPFDDKTAIGVEYSNKHGVLKKAYATKEVILAAGDLQVAKVLFNSGIGPKSILTAFDKPQRVVNEFVGQKIRNHQRVSVTYTDTELVNANYYVTPAASIQYARTGTGIQESRTAAVLAYLNSTNCIRCPDLYITAGISTTLNPYAQVLSISVSLNYNEYANGTLNLTSSDPLAGTLFNANILLLQNDVDALASGILEVRKLMKGWNGNLTETAPGPSFDTMEKLRPFVRAQGSTACHYYSSAPVGTVTDERLKVKGVNRLRVVGPSVINGPVSPGLQALTLALGELATDFIKEDHGL